MDEHDGPFGADAWETHWRDAPAAGDPPNPYLDRETAGLTPGTALDAGCGTGADAVRLAERGWRVTGVDLSPSALATARERRVDGPPVTWLEADLTTWAPAASFDLVMTNYAHAAIPQLELYARLAGWVSPGGTLLVVGHLHAHHGHDGPPEEATTTPDDVARVLDPAWWRVVTAERTIREAGGHGMRLHDVVVRAARQA
jgi:SAM-dependent methyltransferase